VKDPGDNGKPQLGFFLQNFGKCLWPLARLTSFGANSKYKPFDWRTRDNQYFIDKLTRHFLHFIEDPYTKDKETNELHIVAVVFHGLCLIYKITQETNDTIRNQGTVEDDLLDVPMSFIEWTKDCRFVADPPYWHDERGENCWGTYQMQELYQEYVSTFPDTLKVTTEAS
jgi:hypothetical protein